MYKYLIRINVYGINQCGYNKIVDILQQDKGQKQSLSVDSLWYYSYIEYDTIQEADKLVHTLLKIKEIQKEYPNNEHIVECYIVTNKLTL